MIKSVTAYDFRVRPGNVVTEIIEEVLDGSSTGSLVFSVRRAAGTEELQRQANLVKRYMDTHDVSLYGGRDGEVDTDDIGRVLQGFQDWLYQQEDALAAVEKVKAMISKEGLGRVGVE